MKLLVVLVVIQPFSASFVVLDRCWVLQMGKIDVDSEYVVVVTILARMVGV